MYVCRLPCIRVYMCLYVYIYVWVHECISHLYSFVTTHIIESVTGMHESVCMYLCM